MKWWNRVLIFISNLIFYFARWECDLIYGVKFDYVWWMKKKRQLSQEGYAKAHFLDGEMMQGCKMTMGTNATHLIILEGGGMMGRRGLNFFSPSKLTEICPFLSQTISQHIPFHHVMLRKSLLWDSVWRVLSDACRTNPPLSWTDGDPKLSSIW